MFVSLFQKQSLPAVVVLRCASYILGMSLLSIRVFRASCVVRKQPLIYDFLCNSLCLSAPLAGMKHVCSRNEGGVDQWNSTSCGILADDLVLHRTLNIREDPSEHTHSTFGSNCTRLTRRALRVFFVSTTKPSCQYSRCHSLAVKRLRCEVENTGVRARSQRVAIRRRLVNESPLIRYFLLVFRVIIPHRK